MAQESTAEQQRALPRSEAEEGSSPPSSQPEAKEGQPGPTLDEGPQEASSSVLWVEGELPLLLPAPLRAGLRRVRAWRRMVVRRGDQSSDRDA